MSKHIGICKKLFEFLFLNECICLPAYIINSLVAKYKGSYSSRNPHVGDAGMCFNLVMVGMRKNFGSHLRIHKTVPEAF